MKVKKAVIPVAGMGTRLLPVTKSQPKEMLPLGRKPCVQHIVEEMNINLYYTRQKKPAGLGDAVSYGQGFSGNDPVVVALGDA